jgi:hypothetical protein
MGAHRRLATLRAALGFLRLPPHVPELRLLHRWLDSWTGLGLITVGIERRVAEPSPRAPTLMGESQLEAPRNFGVARTLWRAAQNGPRGRL